MLMSLMSHALFSHKEKRHEIWFLAERRCPGIAVRLVERGRTLRDLGRYQDALTAFDVRRSRFPPGSCAETNLAGVHAVLVRPAGDALDPVYVAVAWDLAEHVWESLLNALGGHGTRPVGMDAWRRVISAV